MAPIRHQRKSSRLAAAPGPLGDISSNPRQLQRSQTEQTSLPELGSAVSSILSSARTRAASRPASSLLIETDSGAVIDLTVAEGSDAEGAPAEPPQPRQRRSRLTRQLPPRASLAASAASASVSAAAAAPEPVAEPAAPPADLLCDDDEACGDGLLEGDLAVDEGDASNPQAVSIYARDIHEHLRCVEREHHLNTEYMSAQRDINATMRAILIDWLVEVAMEYKCKQQTLHLAVVLLDRYLSRVPMKRAKLQLTGVTCMLLACKIEEIHPPAADEMVYISDHTYQRSELLHMEAVILQKLEFKLTAATSHDFLQRYLAIAKHERGEDLPMEYLAHYLAELALQDYNCLRFLPSAIAAAAVCLASICRSAGPHWSPLLARHTRYSGADLQRCLTALHELFRRAPSNNLRSVRDKYCEVGRMAVAETTPPDVLPELP